MFLAAAMLLALVGGTDWPLYRHDQNNSGYVAAAGVRPPLHLHRRWTYVADSTITSTPVVVNGSVFIGTWNGDVIALEAATGKLRWKAHLGANSDEVYGGPRGVVGSVAIENGTVFAASGSCAIADLDEHSGAEHWRRKICDIARNDDVYSSSVVGGGLVLIGIDILADRATSRGQEIALDARTGDMRWSVEPAKYRGSGAGVSATPVIVPALSIAYLGTGNATPVLSPPAGDDPGSESIMALDLRSGKTLWTFGPVHPHDVNDDDFLASPNRFSLGSGSRLQWVIGEGNKDGAYYAVRAENGKPLWRRTLDTAHPTAMIVGTAAVGGGAIYVPIFDGDRGSLSALRATDGAILWQQSTGGEFESPVLWGAVVFSTEATGWLDAFRAGNGKPLGRWPLCGRASGRGPSVAEGSIYAASGKCLISFIN